MIAAGPRLGVILPCATSAPIDEGALEPVAVIDEFGQAHSHPAVRARVEELAATLPAAETCKLLLHVPLTATLTSVLRYLAVVEAGHVALVTDPDRAEQIVATYRPDPWPCEGEVVQPRHPNLHPDLALLLSTSGSTGSAKLVRLSSANLSSNADAIAAALQLSSSDRGITSLPLHYCYGLSVLHSHLRVGASVVLSAHSVLDDAFWACVDHQRVSTLAAVPHTFELLNPTPERLAGHPALRLITQAGGRMDATAVTRWSRHGATQGWQLAVMYGQTEATARIAVLDPSQAQAHPGTVGDPVPGTSVHLDFSCAQARRSEGVGELIVRGPGVMLGYAQGPDDLALGAELTELRTGDLARLVQGRIEIVGRRSGFAKIMGLRIDLAEVEQRLQRDDLTTCVTSNGDQLLVAVSQRSSSGSDLVTRARRAALTVTGLPPASVQVAVLEPVRLSNGKIDRARCAELTALAAAGGGDQTLPLSDRVRELVHQSLGVDDVDLRASFTDLGGDSLSHVQVGVKLADVLGPLPRDWHRWPLVELIEHSERAEQSEANPPQRRWTTPVETSVLLRALAAVIICGSHADLFRLLGGAHTLLVVAGFNAARFTLTAPTVRGRWRDGARTVLGFALPTAAIAAIGVYYDRYSWTNVFLSNWLLGSVTYGKHNELWFVDALLACLVLTLAWLSIPAIGRWWGRDPWLVAITLACLALAPRLIILSVLTGTIRGMAPTVLWLFAVGAAIAVATTGRRRAITLAVAAVGCYDYFADDPQRNATVFVGLVLLCLVSQVRLPRVLVPMTAILGAASLYIYLLQFQVFDLLARFSVTSPLLATGVALLAGVVLWAVVDRPVRRLQNLLVPTQTPPRPTPSLVQRKESPSWPTTTVNRPVVTSASP